MKRKMIALGGVIVAALAVGGYWYWTANKDSIVRTEIEKAVEEKSDGLYRVHYDSMSMDEVNGSLSVYSLKLWHDTLKYTGLKRQNKSPYVLFNVSVPQIKISGVETSRAFVDNELSGRTLSLINPVIEIIYTHSGRDSHRSVPDKEIYREILGKLKLIKLDSVVISGAEISTRSHASGKTHVRFKNVSLSLLNFAVDSVANGDSSRLLFAKEVNLDCEKFSWSGDNNLYNYEVNSIAFRSAASTVRIKSILMKPRMNENGFAAKLPVQTDRMDVSLYNLVFRNTDFFKLADEMIIVDQAEVGAANIRIYRDRNRPEDKRNKVGNYPHQLIGKISVDFDIRKATVRNANIEYKEKSTITHQSGTVKFGNTTAYITNITNRGKSIRRNNKMVVDMRSSFLDKIPLYAKWTFDLGSKDGRFIVNGKGARASARTFNTLAVPMGPVEFKSGNIHALEFNLAGNNHHLSGTVKLLYDDFRVSVLRKDKDSVNFEKRRLASLFANLKIEDSNPDDNEGERIAKINIQRDIHRSMFNLVWKGIFEGVKEITNAKK